MENNHITEQSSNFFIPYQKNKPNLVLSILSDKSNKTSQVSQSQSYLFKYRKNHSNIKSHPKKQQQNNSYCSIFWYKFNLPFTNNNTNNQSIKLTFCACQKNQLKICSFLANWIQEFYNWKKDKKFVHVYSYYQKKFFQQNKIIFSYHKQDHQLYSSAILNSNPQNKQDQQINNQVYQFQLMESLLIDTLKTLNIYQSIKKQTISVLKKVVWTYKKHMSYYDKKERKSENNFENNIIVWILMGILYHSGQYQINKSIFSFNKQKDPSLQNPLQKCSQKYLYQSIIFWSIDIVMKTLGEISREVLKQHSKTILALFDQYLPQQNHIINTHKIDLEKIIFEWLCQLMCGYMNLQNLGFYVSSIIKYGWNFIYKVVLSYLDKRMQFIDRSAKNNKQNIIQALINSDQQWPMIFCNATTFTFDKS